MFYKINGSAGYGKTHALIKQIQDLYYPGLAEYQQCFVLITPTNKAAMVLNKRLAEVGLPALARTLHSTLYTWRSTNKIKNIKKVRSIDPDTMKFQVDKFGESVYHEEIEYFMKREVKQSIKNKIVLVDESSMVGSDVWYDLINCGLIHEIHAYGDEKQLPPIEEYEKLEELYKPYFQFWHNFNEPKCVTTLMINYRQRGDLKTFVEAIENTLFDQRGAEIPTPLMAGENFSIHASEINEGDLLNEITLADIVITPYNKVRELTNIISRRCQAKVENRKFQITPVVGDKIIFVDAIKETVTAGTSVLKEIILPKNVCARITEIHDISLDDNLMTMDIEDETGTEHVNIVVSLNKIMGLTNSGDYPRIDYAYAVTVHSSQGGQWDNVLFLDSHWKGDASKLRYVGITRAKKRLGIISGITNSTEAKDAQRSILIRLANQLK